MSFRWREWHHGYLGLLVFGVGFWRDSGLLMVVGAFIAIDDMVQHLLEIETPLTALYGWVYERCGVCRAVNRALDWLFGKRW